jgi:1-acyl-sn-glycerol-3-phosphate acyltransferase
MTPRRPTRRSTVLRAVLSPVLTLLARRRVAGLENIPAEGPCLVVFNQTSLLDTPLVSLLVPRRDVTGLVARDYRPNPVYRFLVECGGGIWIRRCAGDRAALRAALDALRRGWVVGISPEGRRSPAGSLGPGKPGPAYLARRADVPIVPVAFTGTGSIARELGRLRRATVTVRVGQGFRLPARPGAPTKERLRDDTDRIMCAIAALLPPRCRGVYAGHPYLAGGLGT